MWGATASLHTNMQRDYRNTMREIRDLLFQPDQINPVIDAVAARDSLLRAGRSAALVQSPPRGLFLLQHSACQAPACLRAWRGYVQDLKNFMFVGGQLRLVGRPQHRRRRRLDHAAGRVAADAATSRRSRRSIYVGQPGYPMNSLTFECLPFVDPAGGRHVRRDAMAVGRSAGHQPSARRSARLIPPMEWDAVWDSGMLTTWTNRITVPGIYVRNQQALPRPRAPYGQHRPLEQMVRSRSNSACRPWNHRPVAARGAAVLRDHVQPAAPWASTAATTWSFSN